MEYIITPPTAPPNYLPWIAGGPAVLSKSLVSPHGGLASLQIDMAACNGADGYASQLVFGPTPVTRKFVIAGFGFGDGGGPSFCNPYLFHPSFTSVLWSGINAAVWQPFKVVYVQNPTVVAENLALAAGVGGNTGSGFVRFDDVTVEEVDLTYARHNNVTDDFHCAYWLYSGVNQRKAPPAPTPPP